MFNKIVQKGDKTWIKMRKNLNLELKIKLKNLVKTVKTVGTIKGKCQLKKDDIPCLLFF